MSTRRLAAVTGALVALAVVAIIAFLVTGAPGDAPEASAGGPAGVAASSGSPAPGAESTPSASPTVVRLGGEQEPLVRAPLPASASATGALATGFPTGVIPTPTGGSVISSAIATQGDRMQVTLVGETATSAGDVQAFYGGAFAPLGLVGAVSPSQPGTSTTAFARGPDSVTVSTSPADTGTRFTVYAVFSAGG